jgi:hypothetical protein
MLYCMYCTTKLLALVIHYQTIHAREEGESRHEHEIKAMLGCKSTLGVVGVARSSALSLSACSSWRCLSAAPYPSRELAKEARREQRPLSRRRMNKILRKVGAPRTEQDEADAAAAARRREYQAHVSVLRKQFFEEHKKREEQENARKRNETISIQREKERLMMRKRELKGARTAEHMAHAEEARARYQARWEQLGKEKEEQAREKSARIARLVQDLEYERPFWITTHSRAEERVTDQLWAKPGDTSSPGVGVVGEGSGMPGSQHWRNTVNAGLSESFWAERELLQMEGDEEESALAGKYLQHKMQERQEAAMAARLLLQQARQFQNDTRFNDTGLEVFKESFALEDDLIPPRENYGNRPSLPQTKGGK